MEVDRSDLSPSGVIDVVLEIQRHLDAPKEEKHQPRKACQVLRRSQALIIALASEWLGENQEKDHAGSQVPTKELV